MVKNKLLTLAAVDTASPARDIAKDCPVVTLHDLRRELGRLPAARALIAVVEHQRLAGTLRPGEPALPLGTTRELFRLHAEGRVYFEGGNLVWDYAMRPKRR